LIVRLGMALRNACFAAADTLGQLVRSSVERPVRLRSVSSPSSVRLRQARMWWRAG
jgi:hypothetical protein